MTFFRFFIFNLLGNGLPILIALISVPVIMHYGGVDRLGELGVAWGVIGYLGFLDFGLSRVVTRRVALAAESGRLEDELTEMRGFLWWRAAPTLIGISLLLIASQSIFSGYLPQKLSSPEMQHSWVWIVLCVPSTLMANWLRGALEGLQRFARVNLLRTVFGAWSYGAPAVIVLFMPTLDAMVAVIALGRLLAFAAHAWACWRAEPAILIGHAPRKLTSLPLFFREGGWMTVSNLVAPLMVYADRFILVTLFSSNVVAWYVTSQEMMLRALMIPSALAGALFPKFSGASEPAAHDKALVEYMRSIRMLAAIMLPLCTMAVLLGYDGLRLWLGESFAQNGYRVIEIIAIGIFMNSSAFLALAWLQGTGRSHLAARIHMIQLPVYVACLYFAVKLNGIEGAAWMWTIRVGVDCLLMLYAANKEGRGMAVSIVLGGASFVMFSGYLTGPERSWQLRVGIAAAGVIVALLTAWLGLLNREDRTEIGRLRHAN